MQVREVAADEWSVVGWLWQAFRHDLAPVVDGFPYADGRYQHAALDGYPGPGKAGYLAWAPHPNDGEPAPVAFALVDGLEAEVRELAAFFVVTASRRVGTGRDFAAEVISRHPGPWKIAFQHENLAAGAFWRVVAADAFGERWVEERREVPGKPGVPADHWICSDPI
ncbi:MAG TPA: GNAT family N-acetyltransferase [Marmoricola sp.]|jgi:predicted acetyltransferase|nr:GNAT family N-acetyltransferase [Marmoricola sp.]